MLFTKKTLCLFAVDLKSAVLPPCHARCAVEYRLLDAAAWSVQPHTSHISDRHLFHTRLTHGEQFWTAQQNAKIVSYCWVTHAPVEIGEIYCTMHPRADEVYIYDAFTFAEYRGQNLYPALLHRILVHSHEQGLRRALIFVMSDNIASIRGVHKAGFTEFQRVIYRNVLGFGRYTYQPVLNASATVDLSPV